MSQQADTTIRPFTIDIPQSQLDDLKDRLERAPARRVPGDGDYGVRQSYIRGLADHWRTATTGGRSRRASIRFPSSRRRSTTRTSISSTCAHPSRTRSR